MSFLLHLLAGILLKEQFLSHTAHPQPITIDFRVLITPQFFFNLAALRGVQDLSSPARDRTHVTCTGRQTPNHCATREAPLNVFSSINVILSDAQIVYSLASHLADQLLSLLSVFEHFFASLVQNILNSYFPHAEPGIDHFSKEPWFPLVESGIYKPRFRCSVCLLLLGC